MANKESQDIKKIRIFWSKEGQNKKILQFYNFILKKIAYKSIYQCYCVTIWLNLNNELACYVLQ